jgi:hypothetical protein
MVVVVIPSPVFGGTCSELVASDVVEAGVEALA